MANLFIKDLIESVDLDRQAMAAIAGGARIGASYSGPARATPDAFRVVDYPPGFPALRQADTDAIPSPNAVRK